ncbi:uncharacterized protein BROUX77_004420 [Berkeleyomyces rouxiae]|uniref:uncharacterized protein n=1 Tax=Berkeleyomyces rouxiae TaxID=2035830 RepID=UPI003B7F803F
MPKCCVQHRIHELGNKINFSKFNMVRMTIACAACRRSKIKCRHNGAAPCQKCFRTGQQATCELTEPVLKQRPRYSSASAWSALGSQECPAGDAGATSPRRRVSPSTIPAPTLAETAQTSPVCAPTNRAPEPTPATIHRASALFAAKFPDLAFVHMPSVSRDCAQAEGVEAPVISAEQPARALYAALVSLMAPLMHEDGLAAGQVEAWAETARQVAVGRLHTPDVVVVQILVVLAVREWGLGRASASWMYSGMASRMVQLLSCQLTSSRASSSLQAGVFNRTFWACFMLDRQITCIQPQPPMLPLASITQSWPWSAQDFLFGELSAAAPPSPAETMCDLSGVPAVIDMNHAQRLVVEGFDIWADVLRWVVSGGRRRFPREIPWEPGAAWMQLHERLRLWRGRHGKRLCFPETPVETHVSVGAGEMFVFLNLVYYASVLWLHREWIPFLPSPSSVPTGPTDPPLLPHPAPADWWAQQATELFAASSHITEMLFSLAACSRISQHQPVPPCHPAPTALMTPFAGICAFSAATMNVYVACFPLMNHNHSVTAAVRDLERNLVYLDAFRRMWPLGNGWWASINRLKDLYEQARRDGQSFRGGKTRNDYLDLESSIHDTAGMSPEERVRTPNIARMDVPVELVAPAQVDVPGSAHQKPTVASGTTRSGVDLSASANATVPSDVQSFAQGLDLTSNWSELWLLMGD